MRSQMPVDWTVYFCSHVSKGVVHGAFGHDYLVDGDDIASGFPARHPDRYRPRRGREPAVNKWSASKPQVKPVRIVVLHSSLDLQANWAEVVDDDIEVGGLGKCSKRRSM
jgi:hypothetical protein